MYSYTYIIIWLYTYIANEYKELVFIKLPSRNNIDPEEYNNSVCAN